MQEVQKIVLNNISEGVIVIDNKGTIISYNDRAKDIFGIIQSRVVRHPEGNIEQGDMVFVVDNQIGINDGNLNYKDLKSLGINDGNLIKGDSILAFGVYKHKDNKKTRSYRRVEPEFQNGVVILKGEYENHIYKLEIDYSVKLLSIEIDNNNYYISYETAEGHMVILRENDLVFCQQKRYTDRNENIKNILYGGYFREKEANAKEINPIGRFLFDIHERTEAMNNFYKVAVEDNRTIINEYMNINGVSTLLSIMPLYINNSKFGAMIRVEDVTEFEKVMEEKNLLLKSLKEKESDIIYSKNIHFNINSTHPANGENKNSGTLKSAIEKVEKEVIIEAAKRNMGDGKLIIKELNIGKTSFYDKLKKYNINLYDYKSHIGFSKKCKHS